jgi:hypothetical protein
VNREIGLLLVALLTPTFCLAQHASSPLPPNYKTTLEDPTFKIIRVHYGPHEKVPAHDHPDTPTVYVYLNNSGPVRIIHEEEAKPFTIVRPPTHTGAFRISPGRIERHSIENMSDLSSDFLRVELLNLRLGDDTLEFRGPAPDDTTHDLSKVEFSSPRLSILRTICVGESPCEVQRSPKNSVVVAISDTTITTGGHATTLHLGDTLAISPQQQLKIAPAGPEPAHILQILVPTHSAKR